MMPVDDSQSILDKALEIAFPPKDPIQCRHFMHNVDKDQDPLIFTHGAGGTLNAAAIVNFATGFARKSRILIFKGNMNLKSRVKMFTAVMNDQGSFTCLGGRSMGARAAVIAATEQTTHLVLVSYPLHTDKETRDQILFELPASMKVIFVSGDNDNMCDLQRLRNVRDQMKCKSWLVVVEGADHGMNVKPKVGTEDAGKKSGEIVAEWLNHEHDDAREGRLTWNDGDNTAHWSGWLRENWLRENWLPSSAHVGPQPRGEKRKKALGKGTAETDTGKLAKRGKRTKT